MITVDEAIKRSTTETWIHNAHVQNETAYLDRVCLAVEVIALRQALTEAEREIAKLEADY